MCRMAYLTQFSIPALLNLMINKMANALSAILLLICSLRSGSKWPMIGPQPCAYACAYVDPVFTSQSYNISMSTSTKKNELVRFSCSYAYAHVDPVFTGLHMCLCLCLCTSENQALESTLPKLHF